MPSFGMDIVGPVDMLNGTSLRMGILRVAVFVLCSFTGDTGFKIDRSKMCLF